MISSAIVDIDSKWLSAYFIVSISFSIKSLNSILKYLTKSEYAFTILFNIIISLLFCSLSWVAFSDKFFGIINFSFIFNLSYSLYNLIINSDKLALFLLGINGENSEIIIPIFSIILYILLTSDKLYIPSEK